MSFTVTVFDAKPYDVTYFEECLVSQQLQEKIKFHFIAEKLDLTTAEVHTKESDAICIFVNDNCSADVLSKLKQNGIKLILARCAGFDMIDLQTCKQFGISVARVPEYSPFAVAEFAAALLLSLNRKTHKAYNRVRDGDFSLTGLVGFDLHGKTVGVIGTGKIGRCFAQIALGFGCNILAYDVFPNAELQANANVKYVPLEEVFKNADIISLHAPLMKETVHMVNKSTLSFMKSSAVIVNTSRGRLIDSRALLDALLDGTIAGAGLDVYENEKNYFFDNHSEKLIQDPILSRLQNMNNVIITSHQAFLTQEALRNIATCTIRNAMEFIEGKSFDKMTNYIPA